MTELQKTTWKKLWYWLVLIFGPDARSWDKDYLNKHYDTKQSKHYD